MSEKVVERGMNHPVHVTLSENDATAEVHVGDDGLVSVVVVVGEWEFVFTGDGEPKVLEYEGVSVHEYVVPYKGFIPRT